MAAIDPNPERLRNAQDFLGVDEQYCFTDALEAFQRRRADFAVIITPSVLHERYVEMALTFDLDILCEGPLADSMETCLRIYRKVRDAERKMAVVSGSRFEQDKQTLERVLRLTRYGRINYLVGRCTVNFRKHLSWGKARHEMLDPLLIEGAAQHLDVLRFLAGSNAKSVYAASWNPPWGEYRGDSTAFVTIEMDSGAHCHYEGALANASSMNGFGNEYFRAECEYGSVELDQQRIHAIQGGGLDVPRIEDLPMLEQPAWGHAWMAESFCDWLRGGPKSPGQLKEYMRTAALTFAAVESAHTGRAIDVHEFLHRYVDATSSRKEGNGEI